MKNITFGLFVLFLLCLLSVWFWTLYSLQTGCGCHG